MLDVREYSELKSLLDLYSTATSPSYTFIVCPSNAVRFFLPIQGRTPTVALSTLSWILAVNLN